MPSVLIIAGTQVTTSDLHLLYRRAFRQTGWETVFLSHDSDLPMAEKILQQSRLQFSRPHIAAFNRRVRKTVRRLRPDLVLISGSNWYLLPETMRELKKTSGRLALNEQHLQVFRPYQAEALKYYDHVFTQDSALVPLLKAATPVRGVSVLGPACDPEEHQPLELSAEERGEIGSQVAYLGYAYRNRIDLMESLVDFDLKLWGFGWEVSPILARHYRSEPVSGLKKTKIYNATTANLNLQSVSYQVNGVTCRPFEIAACGAFCLSEPRADLGLFFRLGEEMVTFDGAEDLQRKIHYYSAHPDERAEIARRARERVLREHTYQHRVGQVLETLGFI